MEEEKNIMVDKTKSKKKLVIIIVVSIILIAGVACFLLLTKDNDKNKNNTDFNSNSNEEIKNEEEITNNGKKITIYKEISKEPLENGNYEISYVENQYSDSYNYEEIDTYTCETEICRLVGATDKYIIVLDDKKYYIYDYVNNNKLADLGEYINTDGEEVSPTIFANSNGELKAVAYFYNGKGSIYSIESNKKYDNIQGYIYEAPMHYSLDDLADFSLVVMTIKEDIEETNTYKVFNFDTGKVVASYKGTLFSALVTPDNAYALLYDSDNNITVYTLEGKKVFGGQNFDTIIYENDKFVAVKDERFLVYDKNLKLTKQSKEYDEVMMVGKDFALVVDGTKLQLVDLNDNLLTTFITDYDDEKYYVHTTLSGWYKENGKNGIYIVIGQDNVSLDEYNKDNPNEQMTKDEWESYDQGYEYYYIPSTKETGKLATYIGGYAKPVLYLYPTKETNVTVNFEYENMLTTTYPKFVDNWTVTAKPNGDLMDINGRYYYGLYWEEEKNHNIDFDEGFYVESEDAITFLEEKLDYIGFSEREANEFIMYWLPILEKNEKSLVYFELTEEREAYNRLLINPKPDSMLRVAIHVKKVSDKTNIKEQKLTNFNRTGFSVVEWGGVIH